MPVRFKKLSSGFIFMILSSCILLFLMMTLGGLLQLLGADYHSKIDLLLFLMIFIAVSFVIDNILEKLVKFIFPEGRVSRSKSFGIYLVLSFLGECSLLYTMDQFVPSVTLPPFSIVIFGLLGIVFAIMLDVTSEEE
ncbi:YrvL family regulatory protein [Vagococcus intermedius]|uniref:YrvL family regulatory protein n=1 Tax=Vagococcus intermedius TaxID=2991418 RepID=A0AAF0CU06_9ENTE|nr:YrvL family regulatory protein [Vagococcus intermedius]WEG72948.1 YrvL family regulatory protein [Vagococcus intermedius]WEG75034.1 YrvL family regulatory protein [Vagococcus intermedius]